MTQDTQPAVPADVEPSPAEKLLAEFGLRSLAQMRELPHKPGKRTQHDDAVASHNEALVDAVEFLAERLVAERGRAGQQRRNYAELANEYHDRERSLSEANGALRLLWLLGMLLRSHPGTPELTGYSSTLPAAAGTTHERVVRSYQFSFHCGVMIDYYPWEEREQERMRVVLKNGATENFAVHADGTLPKKEQSALYGFLLEHGIKAELPPKRAAGASAPTSPEASTLLSALGFDPSEVVVLSLDGRGHATVL